MIYPTTPNVTSSPVSADGPTLFNWQDGRKKTTSGQAPARANHSARPESKWAATIRAIYGRRSVASSIGAVLQSSLESRLQARMAKSGSPLYALTWKRWDMPSGVPICALRASGHRTHAKDFTGWPTTRANDGTGPQACKGRTGGPSLKQVALLSGWVSPTAQDGTRGSLPPRPHDTGIPLSQMAALA